MTFVMQGIVRQGPDLTQLLQSEVGRGAEPCAADSQGARLCG